MSWLTRFALQQQQRACSSSAKALSTFSVARHARREAAADARGGFFPESAGKFHDLHHRLIHDLQIWFRSTRLGLQVNAFSTSSTERRGRREVAAAAGGGFSPESADISIIRITEPPPSPAPYPGGGGPAGGGGEADVVSLTRPGTGNNAFPSYGPDGSEARLSLWSQHAGSLFAAYKILRQER